MMTLQQNTANCIVVIGSSNVDFIMQVERLPVAGETVGDAVFAQVFGGKGANQATAAARAGGQVTFITGLGQDVYAPVMLENFRRDGIETGRVVIEPGQSCGSALILVDRQGRNCIAVAPGANYALTPAHIDTCADVIQAARMLILQMEIPAPVVQRALAIAAECGTPTLFNYAPVRDQSVYVGARMSTLVVNESEAQALTGLAVDTPEQAQDAARVLRDRGPSVVVVTLGAAGAYVTSKEFSGLIPAFKVTPLDTTAAGDVFCGALAVALVEGRPLPEAVRFANAASALSVLKAGAQPSIPTRAAIDAFLSAPPAASKAPA